jgi:hypothetical protein
VTVCPTQWSQTLQRTPSRKWLDGWKEAQDQEGATHQTCDVGSFDLWGGDEQRRSSCHGKDRALRARRLVVAIEKLP